MSRPQVRARLVALPLVNQGSEPSASPATPHDKPRLEDVAGAAGVSLSTASRAVRGRPGVSDRSRRRVVAAAARLGYEPDPMARALRMRMSPFIGIVVPDITIPFFGIAVKAAQDVLEDAGYQVLVMNTHRDAGRERDALKTLVSHRARGVLVATYGGYEAPMRLPHVFFANFAELTSAPRIALSNRDGIHKLVRHLIEHGHERIAYVGGTPGNTSGSERLSAFSEAMAAAGLGDRALTGLSDTGWSIESSERATMELLALDDAPTAFVAGSDNFALGVLKAIRTSHRRIPEDVALVAFQDPDRVGGVIEPALTTLASQEQELGRQAATFLLQGFTRPESLAAGIEVRLPARLIIRRSCGCPAPE
jgi:LacI family transcriptional regulator